MTGLSRSNEDTSLAGAAALVSIPKSIFVITIIKRIGLDFMAYTRGSSDDYDRYAKVTNDAGWSWNNVQKYFKRVSH